jgi:hypothetical protein
MSNISSQSKRENNSIDSIGSIGTESNQSENIHKGGGFFDFLAGSSSKLLTKAFSLGNVHAALFLLDQNEITLDYGATDKNGRNAIHYMALFSPHSAVIRQKLAKLLETGLDSSYLNKQDSEGNTPLHLAVAVRNNKLAKLMEKNGANRSIKNKYGDYVGIEEPAQSRGTDSGCSSEIFMKKKRPSQNPRAVSDHINNVLNRMIKAIPKSEDVDTIGFTRTVGETDAVQVHVSKATGSNAVEEIHAFSAGESDLHATTPEGARTGLTGIFMPVAATDSFPSRTVGEPASTAKDPYASIDAGLANNSQDANSATDEFVQAIIKQLSGESVATAPLQGGAKKSSVKKNILSRKVVTYSEIASEGGAFGSDSDFESSSSNYSEYARAVENQKSKLHEETVDKIMKALKLDDKVSARSYKAILYDKVKKENPELNGLDRATKMLQMATKTELTKLDTTKLDEIYQHLVEKEKKREERQKESESSEEKPKKTKATKKTKAKKDKDVNDSVSVSDSESSTGNSWSTGGSYSDSEFTNSEGLSDL